MRSSGTCCACRCHCAQDCFASRSSARTASRARSRACATSRTPSSSCCTLAKASAVAFACVSDGGASCVDSLFSGGAGSFRASCPGCSTACTEALWKRSSRFSARCSFSVILATCSTDSDRRACIVSRACCIALSSAASCVHRFCVSSSAAAGGAVRERICSRSARRS